MEEAVLDWGLNPGPPALEASTIPLGYRGGGVIIMNRYRRNKDEVWLFCFGPLQPFISQTYRLGKGST